MPSWRRWRDLKGRLRFGGEGEDNERRERRSRWGEGRGTQIMKVRSEEGE